MSCLTHDKRFCSIFHNIINELRKENRTPLSILRTMPRKCCTCNDEIIKHAIVKDKNKLDILKNLIERINREKQPNPKLILSLVRFQNLIEENRTPLAVLPVEEKTTIDESHPDSTSSSFKTQIKPIKIHWDLSSSSKDTTPMETSKSAVIRKQDKKCSKRSKSIKCGTFLFLPYTFEGKTARKKSDSLVDVAKVLQRNRFIGPDGHVAILEKQYDVRINMITPKTSEQITDALENAKKGLENLTIHNQNKSIEMSKQKEGEWVLVRPKKPKDQINTADFEKVLDDLTDRWERSLKVEKRKCDKTDNSHNKISREKYHSE
ncbi:unnamed protein product [Adineta steineri]|uniref:Uncharacterized protein n=1 Tax=Adineta steineri TaxID=433720 RepID=A0A814TUK6_9BILA|nr:unnamed protein product [Adineta steineri]CAF3820763.1 unnamed protein product [Adineta steineri]